MRFKAFYKVRHCSFSLHTMRGFPIAALEAAVAGTPVLLSDIQPNRDLNLRPENYFKVGDVEQLRYRLAQEHTKYKVARDAVLNDYELALTYVRRPTRYTHLCVFEATPRRGAYKY